uniref:Uncharacterized protein n=1 Tax=Coccidioides posadasii RMSCC 3488 TaxID=454284 RepID=A0A0J6IBU6_COCPO|nr:hypothetical protein CPAG_05420 [Coccidioides posadasii RMSCC 3488]
MGLGIFQLKVSPDSTSRIWERNDQYAFNNNPFMVARTTPQNTLFNLKQLVPMANGNRVVLGETISGLLLILSMFNYDLSSVVRCPKTVTIFMSFSSPWTY